MYLADRGAAVPVLSEALTLAVASGDDALEVEAWARRAWARGTSKDPSGALDGLDLIEPLANRTPAPFVRALLYNNLGSVELGADRRSEARAHFDRALAESQQVTGPHALELLAIRVNAALATDDRSRADRLLADTASELAARLGPDHPDALEARRLRGFRTLDGLREAEQLLAAACTGYELHPALSEEIATCWYEVGFVRWDLGDRPGALEAMQRAARPPGYAPDAPAYALLFRGDAAVAAQRFAEAVAAAPRPPREHWWDRAARAGSSLGLGSARRALGDLAGARAALESAVADLESVLRETSPARFERRLGRARVELALTLAAQRTAPEQLAIVAPAAAAWLHRVGGAADEMTAIDALAAAQGAH
jgi:tetratricopeptide (TPR) repeat protein